MATLTVRKDAKSTSPYWELSWFENKRRHRISLGKVGVISDAQARDILRAKELELSTGAKLLGHMSTAVPTFGDYALEYLLWHQDEFPSSTYRIAQITHDYLIPRFCYTPIDMITDEEVEQMKRERRQQGAKDWTITKELRTLNAIINRAVSKKIVTENPIASVSAPQILDAKPHFFYEAAQLTALYAACATEVNKGQGPQPNPLHAAAWRLFANTGMRRGEGMHLLKKWVGYEGIKIVSTGEERTKSGEWREVPKTEGAAEALDRLKHVDSQYVLPRMTLPCLSRAFVRDARRASLPGSLHSLRHTYISHLMRDTGTAIRTIQLWAGHASIETTEIYLYLRDNLQNTPAARLAI